MQPGKKKQQRKNLRLIGSPQLYEKPDPTNDLVLSMFCLPVQIFVK